MGYPVAYRRGSEAFSPLSPDKYTRPNTKPGPLPVPDNDNEPPPPKSGVPRGVGRAVPTFRRMVRRHLIGLGIDLAEEVANQWFTNPKQWNNNGWERLFGPCVPPASYNRNLGLLDYTAYTCLGGQALVENNYPKPWSRNIIGAYGGATRAYVYIGWRRTSAQQAASPKLFPTLRVLPEQVYAPGLPAELPWLEPTAKIDPLVLPALPWPLVALRPNTQFYERGYVAPVDADLLPSQARAVGVPLWPRGRPEPVPVAPPGAPLKPPGPKVKERKIRMGGYGAVNAVVSAATEGVDFLEALWDALPRNRQTREKGKKTTPQQKALDLYRGWPDIDVAAAIKNVVVNELKDRAIGTIGQAVRKAAQRSRPHGNLPIGYQTGAWDNGVFY